MYINLSRLGKSGTGMWQYSIKFIQTVAALGKLEGIICSEQHKSKFEDFSCHILTVPDWVANTSRISKSRPFFWFFYSYFLALRLWWPTRNKQIVSTTHHGLPLLSNQIVTVHDIRPFNHPDSVMQKIYFHHLLPRLLKRCSQVLTVSNTVRDRISECYRYNKQAIHVIYNSVDTREFSFTEEKRSFLLAVGASWPHKNIHKLLEAHTVWQDAYKLVIVCGRTSYADKLQSLIDEFGLQEQVELRHELKFTELKELYASAAALVYPSIDEGFGIPPIEAMASGTPVIVSDIPVFREVLGDAVLYVEPDQLNSWQGAFNKLAFQAPLYISRGHELAAKYDAKNMQQMIADWLESSK